MDQRHHGLTTLDTDPGNSPDFTKETFMADAAALWENMFGQERPPTVLLGHSFGGAIAVWTAKERPFPSLEGLVVIDVVEGTAIGAALINNQSYPAVHCLPSRLRLGQHWPHCLLQLLSSLLCPPHQLFILHTPYPCTIPNRPA